MAEQADNAAETATESPESRLRGAGFVKSLGFWKEPNGERTFNTEDAIAALDTDEIEPFRLPWPDAGAAGIAEHARITEERIRAAEAARTQPPEPPPMPSWAAPWAELIAAQLKPIIRGEIRAELRKARKP